MSLLEIKLENHEFSTEIILINPHDVESFEEMVSYINKLPPDSVSYTRCKAVIDTGATHTTIPENIANNLNLHKMGESSYKMANGQQIKGNLY